MIPYTFERKQQLSDALMELFHIVTMLRSPEGCPWDRQQNPKSIAGNVQDETYEYIDALDKQDPSGEQEELGDIMLNVMMLLEMHNEKPDFNIVDSINGVCEKLVRRHPHVFSNTSHATTPDEVLDQWNKIKENVEGRKPASDNFFSKVPDSLPPLERAKEISKKASKVGFDWPDKQGVIDKVCEELDEVIEADTALDRVPDEVELEVGDLLFAVINYARHLGVNPSTALYRANRKFEERFNKVDKLSQERKVPLDKEHVKEMNDLWDEVKAKEPKRPGHKEPSTY